MAGLKFDDGHLCISCSVEVRGPVSTPNSNRLGSQQTMVSDISIFDVYVHVMLYPS